MTDRKDAQHNPQTGRYEHHEPPKPVDPESVQLGDDDIDQPYPTSHFGPILFLVVCVLTGIVGAICYLTSGGPK